MSLNEIKEAILQLPDKERQLLIDSFVPQKVELTTTQVEKLKSELESIPDDEWIDWEDLKPDLVADPAD